MDSQIGENKIHLAIREVLIVAVPLILSTSAHTLKTFTDRVFLMRFDPQAMSGAMYADLCHFCIAAFLLGLISYVSTFVSQYYGSGKMDRIGPAVWQGVFIAVVTGVIATFSYLASDWLFSLSGHSWQTIEYEKIYFNIMCIGFVPILTAQAFACFYIGRGKTKVVMYVNFISCFLNIILDYILIFGKFGFKEMGIHGAAYATVISIFVTNILYMIFFFQKKNDRSYHTLRGFGFDKDLMLRIIRFGLPNGINFMLDILAFTAFLAFVGRYGEEVQTATSLVFSLNMLAFMPVVGLGMAVSVLTGKYLGMGKPQRGVRCAWVGYCLAMIYFIITSLAYLFLSRTLLRPFAGNMTMQEFDSLVKIAYPLLCFIAAYSIGDAGTIIFSNVLKGAGDTKFVMIISVSLSWLIMVLPTYLAVRVSASYYIPWVALSAYIYATNFIYLWRFLQGKWKKMSVTEKDLVEPLAEKSETHSTSL